MPLLPIPIDLPPHFVDAAAGDVDGDGRRELVLVSAVPQDEGPDRVELTLVHVSADGRLEGRSAASLGRRASFWEAEGGLWALDGQGVRRIDGDRVVSRTTPLAGLGPTAPVRGDFVHDLDGDGIAELVFYADGAVWGFSMDGAPLGAVRVDASGSLAERRDQGGTSLRATVRTPPMVLGDLDGDGLQDVLLPDGQTLRVGFTGRSEGTLKLGARTTSLALPLDLDPQDQPDAEVKRRITDARFQDVDGDGRVDLVVHRVVSEGSFFGATAEVLLYRGGPSGFGPVQTLATGVGSTELGLFDMDSDGDLDLVLDQVDVGFGNLARALTTRAIGVEMSLYPYAEGAFAKEPRVIHTATLDLEDFELARSLWGDFDLDGRPELVVVEDGTLRVLTGLGGETTELGRHRLANRAEQLLIEDVTGDGRAEILAWAPGESRAVLVVVQP
ncbi:MAG: VCBS repeat-containing protein [Alphaproteobacteria bacterium]|nr:VCBS repeat-containing protein [Alphaproteobacteria bacterium]